MATLGDIRKEVNHGVCSDIRAIMRLFINICEDSPDAVIKAMSARMQTDRPKMMVDFYKDNAGYLLELFNNK